jgi:pimeloyl-ACP methyl ester carboxylesterase
VISGFHRGNAPHKTVRTLLSSLAVVMAGSALLATMPGHAQDCSMAGEWQGSWNGITGQGAATSGSISANFTQSGTAFSGSLTLDGHVIPNITGTNSGAISTSFGSPANPDGPTVSATGTFNSTCNVLEGNYTQTGSTPSSSASGKYTITTQTAVTLLDPIPTLASGTGTSFALDTNPSDMSAAGTPVHGVAADGVANLIIRIANLAPSDSQVTINVINDQGALSTDVTQDGGLAQTGGSGSYTATNSKLSASLTVDTQQEGGSNMAFAVYVPPIDYARLGEIEDNVSVSRQVTLQVLDSDGNELVTPHTALTIFRPPVFLVHGVWSNGGTWNEFTTGMKGLLSGLQPCVADYGASNGGSVSYNTQVVLPQALKCLTDFKKSQNAAAGQLDFIVHSMGGLISNSMPQYPALFQAAATYGQGYIHKLITIDTPYYGSPLAQYLGASDAACKAFMTNAGFVVGGAITDLTPNSVLLTGLYPLPSLYYKHAISGQLSAGQVIAANLFVNNILGLTPCTSVFEAPGAIQLTLFSFNRYFGADMDPTYMGASDMVVSVLSQLGPLQNYSDSFTGYAHLSLAPPILPSSGIPGVLDLASPNPAAAVMLLNDQVSNPAFLH